MLARGPAAIRVIFHADDFGLTRAINAGILEAHACGLLRSASLIGCASAADDAAIGAAKHPDLDVGLHVALVAERPVLPPGSIPSLVTDGFFPRGFGSVWVRFPPPAPAIPFRRRYIVSPPSTVMHCPVM